MQWDVRWLASSASTNADLAMAALEDAPEGTVLATDDQSAGRGRLNRRWEAPPGSGIAVSVLLRPATLVPERWGWISLATGVGLVDALSGLGLSPGLKWPNDVELDGLKVAGILVERVETRTGPAAIVGFGLNTAMTSGQLPIPNATSLHLHGADITKEEALAAVLDPLPGLYRLAVDEPNVLRDHYRRACTTIGASVRVELPGGELLEGLAADVDEQGRLVVDGRAISAGDVVHVRG